MKKYLQTLFILIERKYCLELKYKELQAQQLLFQKDYSDSLKKQKKEKLKTIHQMKVKFKNLQLSK